MMKSQGPRSDIALPRDVTAPKGNITNSGVVGELIGDIEWNRDGRMQYPSFISSHHTSPCLRALTKKSGREPNQRASASVLDVTDNGVIPVEGPLRRRASSLSYLPEDRDSSAHQ
jgi:hypothetical protein